MRFDAFASHFSAWVINECLLTGLAWIAYLVVKKAIVRANDRYLVLKFLLLGLPLVPLVILAFGPMLNWFLVWAGIAHAPMISVLHVTPSVHSALWLPDASRAGLFSPVALGRWWLALFIGYVAHLIFRVGQLIFSARLFAKIAANGERVEVLPGQFVVIHSESFPPATVGLREPKILVPQPAWSKLTVEERVLILRHEQTHILRSDPFFNIWRIGMRAVLVFSPFAFALSRAFEAEMELACDETLLADPRLDRKRYGALLLQFASFSGPQFSIGAYSQFFGSKPLVSRRIEAMKNRNLWSPFSFPKKAAISVSFFALSGGAGWAISALAMDTRTQIPVSESLVEATSPLSGDTAEVETTYLHEGQKGDMFAGEVVFNAPVPSGSPEKDGCETYSRSGEHIKGFWCHRPTMVSVPGLGFKWRPTAEGSVIPTDHAATKVEIDSRFKMNDEVAFSSRLINTLSNELSVYLEPETDTKPGFRIEMRPSWAAEGNPMGQGAIQVGLKIFETRQGETHLVSAPTVLVRSGESATFSQASLAGAKFTLDLTATLLR